MNRRIPCYIFGFLLLPTSFLLPQEPKRESMDAPVQKDRSDPMKQIQLDERKKLEIEQNQLKATIADLKLRLEKAQALLNERDKRFNELVQNQIDSRLQKPSVGREERSEAVSASDPAMKYIEWLLETVRMRSELGEESPKLRELWANLGILSERITLEQVKESAKKNKQELEAHASSKLSLGGDHPEVIMLLKKMGTLHSVVNASNGTSVTSLTVRLRNNPIRLPSEVPFALEPQTMVEPSREAMQLIDLVLATIRAESREGKQSAVYTELERKLRQMERQISQEQIRLAAKRKQAEIESELRLIVDRRDDDAEKVLFKRDLDCLHGLIVAPDRIEGKE